MDFNTSRMGGGSEVTSVNDRHPAGWLDVTTPGDREQRGRRADTPGLAPPRPESSAVWTKCAGSVTIHRPDGGGSQAAERALVGASLVLLKLVTRGINETVLATS